MKTVICPICKGQTFSEFAGRPQVQCMRCRSLERGRAIYLALRKLDIPRPDDKILHFAPEKCFIDIFTESHGDKYQPVDLCPELYKYPNKKVQRIDICEDLYSLPSESWDLILHNHILEHLLCSLKGILRGFDRLLKPGGTMIFTIPVWKGRKTIEDLNPYLSEAERLKKFGQKDHVRLFGDDIIDIIQDSLGTNCFIPSTVWFTQEEFLEAGIPWEPEIEPNGNSIFLYQKKIEKTEFFIK